MNILLIGTDNAGDWQPYTDAHCFAFFDGFDELAHAEGSHVNFIRNNCHVYARLDAALEAFHPDLAAIHVPNFAKNNLAYEISLLKRGIPVYESKLRLRGRQDYNTLHLHVQTSRATVHIGEFYRYDPRVLAVKRLLDSGAIGKPEQMRWRCGLSDGAFSPWETTYTHLAQEDLAYHHYSVMHLLLNLTGAEILTRSASPEKAAPLTGTVSDTLLTTASGCRVSHSIDWHNTMAATDYLGNFYIDGTRGGVVVEGGNVYTQQWGGERMAVPVAVGISPKAIDHLPAFEPDKTLHTWTFPAFASVMACVYGNDDMPA